ncbi:MAG: hypothetical protein C4547_07725 [Phycisphaerales bacterium]|nr:MAG: hypothetical protein C4547_07725 [Phycisphaerales bacterium]
MTEQAQDMMSYWMDESQQMWRSGMTATTRFVEAASKVWTHLPTVPATPEELRTRGERITDTFTPFVRRSADLCMDVVQSQMKAGMDAFGEIWKRDEKANRFDVAEQTRRIFSQGVEMTRRNLDAAADAGLKLADNWTQFCNDTCAPAPAVKPAAPKTPK